MDDDWNDDYSTPTQYSESNFASEVVDRGVGFGRGRGVSIPRDEDDSPGYRSYGGNNNGNGHGGDSSNNNFGGSSYGSRGSRVFRGGDRGSRGDRGGRGGRGSFRGGRDRDSDHNGGDGENGDGDYGSGGDNGYSSGGRGGRGGRGGGRGRGDRNDPASGEGDGGEKPRENYIPPEPSEDTTEIFGSGITSGINFSKYDDIKVEVTGSRPPRKIECFRESGLRPILIANIEKCKYKKPTPVQKNAIPIIMDGRDLMACAQTGSGKTAAFLLPIIHNILENPTGDDCEDADGGYRSSVKPMAVIVSPTRELSIQIFNESRKFAHSSVIRSCVVYGGTSTVHQINQVRKGCHILVATPGRLQDMVDKGVIAFNSVRFFVLDEADRMLDMGFMPAVERLMDHSSMVETGQRQTLMFSATFPEEVQQLATKFLHDYLFLTVGIVGGACSDVEQRFYEVTKFEKRKKLVEMLRQAEGDGEELERTLVFVEQKRLADFIAAFLSEQRFPTTSIHGDRLQSQREAALADFKRGSMPILVATAVAARGLDIKNVAHVVNFDLPKSIDEYVHRIGRTGRVGNRGKATSFFDPDQDAPLAKDLVKILQQAKQEIPSWLSVAGSAGSGSGYSSGKFGGRDYRRFDQGESASNPEPVSYEEQEIW